MPLIMEAKPLIQRLKTELASRVDALSHKSKKSPKLVVVLVGDNPASHIYVKKKAETAKELGFAAETRTFPASADPTRVKVMIDELNRDHSVHGILIQRPLPPAFKEEEVLLWVDPDKDVDGLHPENQGRLLLGMSGHRSCTPLGIMQLLDHYEIELSGKIACVVGRSAIVGKPMIQLLLARNATPIQIHSSTPHPKTLMHSADIVVLATGRAQSFDQSFIKKGAVVVDVGISRLPDGKVVGDANFESLRNHVSAITPVPGGVGPMTIMMLLKNTLDAAEKSK